MIVAEAATWGPFEEGILAELAARKAPVIVVFNKADLAAPDPKAVAELKSRKMPLVETVACAGKASWTCARR